MTYLGQIKKDTKISPDIFVPHIQRGWGSELKIIHNTFNVVASKNIYIFFSILAAVTLCYNSIS